MTLAHFARHPLADVPFARESFLYDVKLPDAGLAGLVYTWVDAAGDAGHAAWIYGGGEGGATLFEFGDGIAAGDSGFDEWEVGPLSVAMHAGNAGSRVRYDGDRIGVELEFSPMHEAYLYSGSPIGCPPYFATDRMEQSGRVTGRLRIDDRWLDVDALGHHDHSWGVRDWGAIQHYKWIEAQAPDTSVHLSDLFAYGRRDLVGYVFRDGVMASVLDADWDVDYDERWMQKRFAVTVQDDAGRRTTVRADAFADFVFPVSPDATLMDAMLRVEIDGRAGAAFSDFLWPPAYLEHITR